MICVVVIAEQPEETRCYRQHYDRDRRADFPLGRRYWHRMSYPGRSLQSWSQETLYGERESRGQYGISSRAVWNR